MNKYDFTICNKDKFLIIISFIIALFLQNMSWPEQLYIFKPSWALLIFIYWLLMFPYNLNVVFSFIVGIIIDVVLGSSCLGIQTLSFVTIAYIILIKFNFINNSALWHQSIIIVILSLLMNMIIFLAEHIIHNITFRTETTFHSIIDGMLWPWIFLIMQKIRYKKL